MHNSLKTQDRLKSWDHAGLGICVFCQNQPDSHNHLFFECKFPYQLWRKLCQYSNIQDDRIIGKEIVSYLELTSNSNMWGIVRRLVFGATVHYVWQERNNRIFKRGSRTCEQLF